MTIEHRNATRPQTRKMNVRIAILACSVMLAACGGGGGNPGTIIGGGTPTVPDPVTGTPAVPAAPTVTLAFVNAAGQSSNALTGATPLTARASVKDKDGKAVANALVVFATDNTLAVFSPSAGTALTDANGVASVTLRPAGLAAGGAGKVSASADVAGTTIAGEANFSVGATALSLGALSLAPASIAAYGSTVVTVDVLAGGARYTDQQLIVSLRSACVTAGKATLAATVPTNNGTAQAVYRDQGCASNDLISASVDGATQGATAALAIAAPAAASVQFSSAAPTDKSIVIKGQGGIGRTETATLTFKVFDIFNNPLAGQIVTFSTVSPDVTINKGSDSTDQNGEVITTVNSGTNPTSFRIQATLPSGISTISDSIVVSTGLPVQRAFSLSVGSPNIEGLNYDSAPDTPATMVNILLADNFGNPVADGTPVSFQTNAGAVGSSSKGACNTVNGGCSVDFRSQNPRVPTPGLPRTPCNDPAVAGTTADSTRAGLATVCASSTDGSNTVFGKVGIFLSGSTATHVYLDGGNTPLSSVTPTDLGTASSDGSRVFTLQINDQNLNPMPAGTRVAMSSLVNASGDVQPATVPNIFPHSVTQDQPDGNNVSGNQGSRHAFTISSTAGKPCTGSSTASFNVTITTPHAITSTFPFKLAFSCP